METKIINSFPGYKFENGTNFYRGDDIGKGGWIYAEEGMYTDVALLDIQSMHPNSAVSMNVFGEYTQNFKDILDARVAIKHGDYETAKKLFGGKLTPYLDDKRTAKDLSQALKIAINSVYGLTSANFDNPFRDNRNKNNIVALKGALFMRTLQDEVKNQGFTVASIRTDSIKIPNATPDIIKFCMEFARKYGYIFEHEATYERLCLVNKSAYIAKYASVDRCYELYGKEYVDKDADTLKENKKHPLEWSATATQFQVPYVFKTLFSKEPIEFNDMCETKEVKTALYLDMNEKLPEGEHDYKFIGRVGLFCPIKPGCGGGELVREGKDKNGNVKYDSATGASGYRWLESETVESSGHEVDIDRSYYDKLVDAAVETISKYGDFEWFVSDDTNDISKSSIEPDYDLPWRSSCGKDSCRGCEQLPLDKYNPTCMLGYDISDYWMIDDGDMFSKR